VEERKNPTWATACGVFLNYVHQVADLQYVTRRGIEMLSTYPALVEVLKPDESDQQGIEKAEGILEDNTRMAELAKSEIENDFPLAHSAAIMGVWGALEAMVEDLAICWMMYNPSVLDEPKVAKIKGPLVEFQKMSEEDRLRFLVAELQRDLGSEFKGGANKFESLLGAIGLGGPVDKRVKDVIFEAQNLRNLFAHRGGVADSRFISKCPHLKYSVGDSVRIGYGHYWHILNGLLMYDMIVMNRCRVIDGSPPFTGELPGFEGSLSGENAQKDPARP
jgi:hypothetical protein